MNIPGYFNIELLKCMTFLVPGAYFGKDRRGGGPQTDKHLPPSTFTGQFVKKSRHLGFETIINLVDASKRLCFPSCHIYLWDSCPGGELGGAGLIPLPVVDRHPVHHLVLPHQRNVHLHATCSSAKHTDSYLRYPARVHGCNCPVNPWTKELKRHQALNVVFTGV